MKRALSSLPAITLAIAACAPASSEHTAKNVTETAVSSSMALLAGVTGRITTLGYYANGARHPGVNAIDIGAGGGTPVRYQVDYIPEYLSGGWIRADEIHEPGYCSQWSPGSPYYNGSKIVVYAYFYDVDGNFAGWHRAAFQHVSPNVESLGRWWRWNNKLSSRPAWPDPEMTLGDTIEGGLYLGEVFGVSRRIYNGPNGGLCTDGSHLHQEGDGSRAAIRTLGETIYERYSDLHIFTPHESAGPAGDPPWGVHVEKPIEEPVIEEPVVEAPVVEGPARDPCAELGYAGACDGSVLVWCENGELKTADCSAWGLGCGWENDSIGNNCL